MSAQNSRYLSNNNPYVALSTEDPDDQQNERLTNTVNVAESDNFVIVIPSELVDRAVEIEKYSCSIRFICLS